MSQKEEIELLPSSNSGKPDLQLPDPSGKEIRESQEPDIRQLLNQLSREARPAAVHQLILVFLTNAFSGSGKFLDTTMTPDRKFSAQIQLDLVNQIINISDISQAENSDQYSKYLAPGLQKAVHRFLFLRNLEQIFAASAQQAPEPQSRSDPRPMSHLQSIIDCLLSLKNLAGDETYKTWRISDDPQIAVGHTIVIITQFMNSINSGNPDYRLVTQITRNLGLREAVVAVGKRQIDALQRFRTEGRTLSKEQAREWLFRLQDVAPWLTPYLQGELTKKRYDELMRLARLFFTNEQQQYVNLLPRMLNDAGLLGFDPSAKQKPSRKEPSKWFG
ncbi:MAG TPA: hypothetical protein PLM16_01620 [Candidatus Woesebacteria bacterium]|nr:hypothetical protein [Candidatus Woesebacteria bacterium]